MRFILLYLANFACGVAWGQTILTGNIAPSRDFQPKLYILRHHQIDLHEPVVYDSVVIAADGNFSYRFENASPEDIIYQILLPATSGNRLTTLGTLQKNFIYVSTERRGTITIESKGDSLFYAAKYAGKNTASIQYFTNLQKPFYNLERALVDSIAGNPGLQQEYKQRLLPVWMKTVESLKPKIMAALDTARSATTILMGLQLLFESNFGKLDSATAERYLAKITNQNLLLVRTIRELTKLKRSDRTGMQLPNVQLMSANGKRQNLYDYKSDYLLIDFWASWCSPCRYANRNELPHLFRKFKDRVDVIGITVDEDLKKWKNAVIKDSTSWTQYIDKAYLLKSVLSIQSVPVYLLVDKDHKVIFESISVYQMHEHLKKILVDQQY